VLLIGAVAGADGEVAPAAPAGQGAVGVVAAEAAEVVHAGSGGSFGLEVSVGERVSPFNARGTLPGVLFEENPCNCTFGGLSSPVGLVAEAPKGSIRERSVDTNC
jgi:hypothetical protein